MRDQSPVQLFKSTGYGRLDQLLLQFYDVPVQIRTDSPLHLRRFHQLYPRFEIEMLPTAPAALVVTLLTTTNNPYGRPVLVVNGQPNPLTADVLTEEYIYHLILSTITARVRSHFLVHAGVVSRQGKGLVIVGDSAHGKTTLVLELIRRGFQFLSDEFAALGRSDQLLHPFPRSLRVRPGTLQLVNLPQLINTPVWVGKHMFDVEQLRPGSLGVPVPISAVVFLRHADEPAVNQTGRGEKRVEVLVNRVTEAFLTDLVNLSGDPAPAVNEQPDWISVAVTSERRIKLLNDIGDLCHSHDIMLRDVVKRQQADASFTGPARLENLTRSQAVLALMRRFQGGHQSDLLTQDFRGSTTRLFMMMAGALTNAGCYWLFPGVLADMADLVTSTLDQTPTQGLD
jgi:hypothetical protein